VEGAYNKLATGIVNQAVIDYKNHMRDYKKQYLKIKECKKDMEKYNLLILKAKLSLVNIDFKFQGLKTATIKLIYAVSDEISKLKESIRKAKIKSDGALYEIKNIQVFFKSQWFANLVDIDSKWFRNKLDEVIRDEFTGRSKTRKRQTKTSEKD